MYILDTNISCGIFQLENVGKNPTQKSYEDVVESFIDDVGSLRLCMLIASVPAEWKKSINFLNKIGFKAVNRGLTNPNSGNKIILFVKTFTKRERETLTRKFNHAHRAPRVNYY